MLQPKITKIDRWRYKLLSKYCIGNVLDVGCGKKGLQQYLPAGNYLGCDIGGGDLQSSAYSLPYKDKSFDTVVLLEILEHLGMPIVAIKEATRVSAKRIIVTVPNDYSLVRLSRLFLGRDVEIEPEHLISYNSWNLARCFESTGFKAVEYFCYPLRLQFFPEIPVKSRFGYWLFSIMDRIDYK